MRAGGQTRVSGGHWKRDAVLRLIDLCGENGLTFDSADEFCNHFNIPDNVSKEEAEKVFENPARYGLEKIRDADD